LWSFEDHSAQNVTAKLIESAQNVMDKLIEAAQNVMAKLIGRASSGEKCEALHKT